MKKLRISPSLFNLYFDCPKAFYYHVKGYIQLPTDSEPLLFGRTIHSIIALFYERLREGKNTNLSRLFDEVYEEYSNSTTDKDYKRIQIIKRNFIDFEKRRQKNGGGKDYMIEKKFETKLKISNYKITFVGIVDFYDKTTHTLVDWKTGNAFLSGEKYIYQAHIYKKILADNKIPVKKVIFFNLDSGQNIPIPSIQEERFKKKIYTILSSLEKNEFPARKSYICKNCGYRLRCQFEGVKIWEIEV